jgi:hypothetical protein
MSFGKLDWTTGRLAAQSSPGLKDVGYVPFVVDAHESQRQATV